VNFAKLTKKTKLSEKFKLLDKRGFKLTEKRRADSCPPANPHSETEHEVYSMAEYEKLEKVLDFIATTKNISIINILLVLNSKHSIYWE